MTFLTEVIRRSEVDLLKSRVVVNCVYFLEVKIDLFLPTFARRRCSSSLGLSIGERMKSRQNYCMLYGAHIWYGEASFLTFFFILKF